MQRRHPSPYWGLLDAYRRGKYGPFSYAVIALTVGQLRRRRLN